MHINLPQNSYERSSPALHTTHYCEAPPALPVGLSIRGLVKVYDDDVLHSVCRSVCLPGTAWVGLRVGLRVTGWLGWILRCCSLMCRNVCVE